MDTGKKGAALALLEGGATAAGLGYLHGRKGSMPEKYKIPLDAALGVGLPLLGIFGGKYIGGERVSKHLVAAGSGALFYFLGSLGGQFGQKARAKAGEMKGAQGQYLTGAKDPVAGVDYDPATGTGWRTSRTITAGMPVSGPVSADYASAWNRR